MNELLIKKNLVYREDLVYKMGRTKKELIYNFRKFKTMWSYKMGISNGIVIVTKALDDQINQIILRNPQNQEIWEKEWQKLALASVKELIKGRQWNINAFESWIFSAKNIYANAVCW